MFATLLGGLPTPDAPGDLDALVQAVVRAQEDARLEPITDGRLRDHRFERLAVALAEAGNAPGPGSPTAVDWWRFAAGLTDRAVKQALPGPYTLGRWISGGAGAAAGAGSGATSAGAGRGAATMKYAEALRREVEALAAAGCPMVEIEEAEAHLIGEDEAERRLFREAHEALTVGVTGTHLSLSIVGKAAWSAGIDTILDAPYASLAVDLIKGPDNWNLVTRTPGDRGIVVGALSSHELIDEPKEVLLWAAHYAASTGGRGIARVGIGSAGSYANLTWAAALRKLRGLGTAAKLAALPPGEELAGLVDPRSISARRAALGGNASPSPRPRRSEPRIQRAADER